MDDKKRLTELCCTAYDEYRSKKHPGVSAGKFIAAALAESGVIVKPCENEQSDGEIANVIVKPCKIGQVVYKIAKVNEVLRILPREVVCMRYYTDYFGGEHWELFTTSADILGNTVFLTAEEAAAALAKRIKENGKA